MSTNMKHLDKCILRLLCASDLKSITALLKEPETPEIVLGSESMLPLLSKYWDTVPLVVSSNLWSQVLTGGLQDEPTPRL